MRLLLHIGFAAVLFQPAFTFALTGPGPALATPDDSVSFSVGSRTQVPGTTLSPGTYAIRVVDHLSDRVILSIQSQQGKTLTTFLALPNPMIRQASLTGAIPWPNGPHKQSAMRGFSFPGGNAVEFVYPKADAVEIAKVNTSKVAAIDPASEGRPTNNKKLSAEDLQMLTLWSLSSTRVGPENASQPAIAAERYQPVQQARNEIPPAPTAPRSAANRSSIARTQTSGAGSTGQPSATPVQRAPLAMRRPALAVLPHTASNDPLVLMAGLLALLASAGMWLNRRTHDGV